MNQLKPSKDSNSDTSKSFFKGECIDCVYYIKKINFCAYWKTYLMDIVGCDKFTPNLVFYLNYRES